MMLDPNHTRFRCDQCGAERSCDLTDSDGDGLHDIGDGRDLCSICFGSNLSDNDMLFDSDTADPVTAEELGITAEEYRQAIADSMAEDTPEGHIYVNGRRVYAQS